MCDEALNAVENELGNNSLRSHYNILEFYDDDFVESLDFYISDPDYQTLLNQNHEVKIEGNCYVWLSPTVVAIVEKCDKEALALVEELGIFATGEGISIIDETTGKPLDIHSGSAEERGDCILSFNTDNGDDEDWNDIEVDALLRGDNNLACGGVIWSINWGDGFTTNPNDGSETHSYNVNLEPGACQSFTITVTATPLAGQACDCTIKTYTQTASVSVCRPIGDCYTGKKSKEEKYYFEYDGKEYRIRHELGQRSSSGFLSDEKVWVKAIFQKKKSNGKWRRRKPGKKLVARVHGHIVKNQCSLLDDVDKQKKKRKKRIVKKYKPDQEFSTLKEGNNKIFGDYYAEMDDDFIEGFTNFTIFD